MSVTPIGVSSFTFIRQFASQSPGVGYYHSFSGSRTSSTSIKFYYDGILVTTNTTADTGAIPTYRSGIGAVTNTDTTQSSYCNLQSICMHTIGGGLTDTEMSNLYAAGVLYQKALGRFIP